MNRYYLLIILFLTVALHADNVYKKNKRANKLFQQGKYGEALLLYDDALLEAPQNSKLSINKGSAHYRLQEFDKAIENYTNGLSAEDKDARADAHYNLGNTLTLKADQLAAAGSPQAMENYKAARDHYINTLDLRPHDKDAKWNLQVNQMKIKQLEQQQQQQQQQNQNNQNQDNKDKKEEKQDQQNQENKQQNDQNQQKQKQEQEQEQEQEQQQQQQQQQPKKEEQQQQQVLNDEEQQESQQQKPQPKPEEEEELSQEQMEKEKALLLIQQYADDEDELNKPPKKMQLLKEKNPEKDW